MTVKSVLTENFVPGGAVSIGERYSGNTEREQTKKKKEQTQKLAMKE
jgi:hypothetical protein